MSESDVCFAPTLAVSLDVDRHYADQSMFKKRINRRNDDKPRT